MFASIIAFFVSLFGGMAILIFLDPDKQGGLGHLYKVLFSIDLGIFVGSLFSIFSFLLYLILGSYKDIESKAYLRRGGLLATMATIIILLKVYSQLNVVLAILIVCVGIALEIILTDSRE